MNFNAISVSRYLEDRRSDLLQKPIEQRPGCIQTLLEQAFKHVVVGVCGDLVHVQYMGPRFENGADRSLQQIREVMGRGKLVNRNAAVSIDTVDLSILHQFGPKAIAFGSWEAHGAPLTIFHELLRFQRLEDHHILKTLQIPVGLQLQACWRNGQWLLASRSFCFINDQRPGVSQVSVQESLEQALAVYSVDLSAMNKDRLYTFLLTDPRLDPHINEFNIYLMSVFDRVNKCAVEDDAVKKSKVPRLKSRRITIQEAFSNGQLPGILKKAYAHAQATAGVYSLVLISPDNTYYEIETEVANQLRAQSKNPQTVQPVQSEGVYTALIPRSFGGRFIDIETLKRSEHVIADKSLEDHERHEQAQR